ncbi:DEKNAAC102899 [Brettanomyces naardenensis]|uniref:Protein YIP n=1 Tax=Brettanomyces naardenensis TaxID=13370 RepID=A0A448YLW7_BRENA|nr:DEKNAAC102899 [Brettanomyces naardenensis]
MSYHNVDSSTSDPFDIDRDDDIMIQPDNEGQTYSSNETDQRQQQTIGQQAYIPDLMQDVTIDSGIGASGTIDSGSQNKVKKTYSGGPFSVNYYRRYFDLDTPEFFRNCWKSLNPFSRLENYEFQEVGDLYGTVWITATLIFLLFFCNSFADLITDWIQHDDEDKLHINYFGMLLSSINILYGYVIIVPLVLWVVLKFYMRVINLIPLTKLISIYAYANLLWIPAAFLSIFRGLLANHRRLDNILKWICIALGGILSGTSVFVKLVQYFNIIYANESPEERKRHIVVTMTLLALAHAGFSIAVKACFFGSV